MKKLQSLILAILWSTGFAFSASSGTCGDDLTWTLDDEGVLTISGTGAMTSWYTFIYKLVETEIKSVVIESGVTSISEQAFYECTALTSIEIPESVTSIGSYAFYGCTELTSITLPSGLTSISDYTFCGCSSLTSLEIPESVTSIGSKAFSSCSSLTSIVIPENVASIGSGAFYDCTTLTSVTSLNSTPPTCDYMFSSDTHTTATLYAASNLYTYARDWKDFSTIEYTEDAQTNLTSISGICGDNLTWTLSFADSTLTITGSGDMYGRSSGLYVPCLTYEEYVTTVSLPEEITNIGDSAFLECTALTTIEIPENVTSIGKCAFDHCSSLESITLPSGLTSISNATFRYCSSLTSIEIPESVTSIGTSAFYGCSSLASITLPSGLTSISDYTFYNCASLTSIEILESVTSIGECAFYNCSSLTSIEIPESVTSIGECAFYKCTALTSVTSLASTPPTCGSNVFSSSTYTDATLYAASTDYLTADYWEDFENCVISGNAISDIAAEASTIRTVGNTIVITSQARATAKVVSLSGIIIKEVLVYQGETQIQMAHDGVYIVLLSDGTKAKVLIK